MVNILSALGSLLLDCGFAVADICLPAALYSSTEADFDRELSLLSTRLSE